MRRSRAVWDTPSPHIAGYHSMTRNSRRTLPNYKHSKFLRLSFPSSVLGYESHDTSTPTWSRWHLAMKSYRGRAWRPTTTDRHSQPPKPYFCTILSRGKVQKKIAWACRYVSAYAAFPFLINAYAYYPQLHRSLLLFPSTLSRASVHEKHVRLKLLNRR